MGTTDERFEIKERNRTMKRKRDREREKKHKNKLMEHTCTQTLTEARKPSIYWTGIYIQHVFRSFFCVVVSFFFILFMSFVILLPYTYLLFLLRFCIKSGTFGTHVCIGFRTLLHTDTHIFEATKININTHFFSLFRSWCSSLKLAFSINFQQHIFDWLCSCVCCV